MNSRARRILQLAAEQNAKLYSDDSDCEIPHKQIMRSSSSQDINSPGPSHAFQSEQRMSLRIGGEIRQEIETVQHGEEFDVEGDAGEAEDGNPIQTLRDLVL
ncbi:hypothetical protein FQA39_LY14071 [Lamprigera yunnana]|nr:hypothetical protein FQA39_LY14071 [Lamprigera yunnana]